MVQITVYGITRDMWIILLDCSSSMGETFRGNTEFAGRSRPSESAVKLDAAKDALQQHLLGLGTPSRIALFEFTSTASLIFEGISNDSIGIRQALNNLSAHNGTNIASALTKVFEYASQVPDVSIFRVLVISDGLSKRESAEQSAQNLASKPSLIDVILIDPTEEGEVVARAIAINGTVLAITSSEKLASEISEVDQTQTELVRQIETAMREYEQEAKKVAERTKPEEKLSFTACYQSDIRPKKSYNFVVYLHLTRLQDEVMEKVRENQLNGLSATSTVSGLQVVRRTKLKITPKVDEIVFTPSAQDVVWNKDIQEVNFELEASLNATGPKLGSVEVYLDTFLIAQIPLSFNIRDLDPNESVEPITTTCATIFNSIFVSYSREDFSIVASCMAAYEALGIYVYIDIKSLKSGDLWSSMLCTFIRKSDLFQLYWSHTSSKSQYVEREWKHALTLINAGEKGKTFIRPLRWEEKWPAPPNELSSINFAFLDVSNLKHATGFSSPISNNQLSTKNPSLPVTVLPILPSRSLDFQSIIQDHIIEAVNFLEETTNLRYYPVPTLLVDEYLIKSARTINTKDFESLLDDQKKRALALSDVLNSIALKFHMTKFIPQYIYRPSDFQERRELSYECFCHTKWLNKNQFNIVQDYCEHLIRSMIYVYFQPSWLTNRANFRERFPDVNLGDSFSDFILAVLDHAIANQQTNKNNTDSKSRSIILNYFDREKNSVKLLEQELITEGINVENKQNYIQLKGSFSQFMSALKKFRKTLNETLPRFDYYDTMLASIPNPDSEKSYAMLWLFDFIYNELGRLFLDGKSKKGDIRFSSSIGLLNSIGDILNPSWRKYRDELCQCNLNGISPDLGFIDFLEKFLDIVNHLLEEGLKNLGDFACSFTIEEKSWNLLSEEFSDLNLNSELDKSYGQNIHLRGQFSEITKFFKHSSTKLIELLGKINKINTQKPNLFIAEVATFGIYLPANSQDSDACLERWAIGQGIATELTLPKTPRVLFCLNAHQSFETKLRQKSYAPLESLFLAIKFQRSVLIHEHFHAILETGLSVARAAASGPKSKEAWRAAFCLNESLAAWMQLHAARQDEQLTPLIWEYINAGSYPEWPYRGAEKIEEIYQKEGIDKIRAIIEAIRQDPKNAQDVFDKP